MSVEELKGLKK
jgi:hypothetical protein